MSFGRAAFASLPFAAALSFAASCGGTVVQSASGDAGAGAGTGAGAGAATSSTGAGAGSTSSQATTSGGSGSSGQGTGGAIFHGYGCPTSAPTAGASCSNVMGGCTYGDSVLAQCRDAFVCQSGTWLSASMPCDPQPPSCPASQPQAQTSCDADAGADLCTYPTGSICECSACGGVGPMCMPAPAVWYCESPARAAGCPTLVPNEGSSCPTAGLACSYPGGCGVVATCGLSNAWTWAMLPCPP